MLYKPRSTHFLFPVYYVIIVNNVFFSFSCRALWCQWTIGSSAAYSWRKEVVKMRRSKFNNPAMTEWFGNPRLPGLFSTISWQKTGRIWALHLVPPPQVPAESQRSFLVINWMIMKKAVVAIVFLTLDENSSNLVKNPLKLVVSVPVIRLLVALSE